MPITLTTPLNAGDLDAGVSTYAEAKIISFTMSPLLKTIALVVRHGNTTGGVWASAPVVADVTEKKPKISGADYDALIAKTSSAAGEVYYDEVARELYQWLIDQGHYAGAIT